MAIIALNVRLPWTLGSLTVAGALSSNTYHFDTGATAPTEGNTAFLADSLISLYGTELDGLWSSVFTGEIVVSATNITAAPPRVAYGLWGGTLTPEANSLPGEVAAKVQIRATPAAGVPSQRFRGTLQLGPLAQGTLGTFGLFSDATMDTLLAGYTDFRDAVALGAFPWVVGSAASGWEPVSRVRLVDEAGTVGKRQYPVSDSRDIAV